jgi:TP901 family phage tail tape measure protein
MADDIQSNIRINVDTASAMDSIRLLQNQISAFHTQMSKMGAASAADSRNLQQNLVNSINATGAFTANMTKVRTTAEQFSLSLEKNKLSMGEYFRYAGGASKSFGRMFKAEFETINKVARERVKDLQSQYIKLGRDANGAMQAIRVRPLVLDMENLGTKTQIAAQRQQLLNQLLKQGSTNLLNFGKNTQWAGRQLMVGFTIPLSIMGSAAMKSYKEIEEAGIRLKRVYGDLGTTNMETEKMVKQVQMLAQEYTKYGVAVKDSMEMAATAAATGKKGADLLAQVSSSARLAVLGGVDQQMALKTTISLTDAFGVSTKQLSKDINFLNAVENQTVLSIEDMTIAIPKAAPVIQQLGGDVKDLAFFLTAMKEGGINASESANALKSGLASLINPTNTASKMLQGFGINLREIVQGNKGDVKKTVVDFAQALDKLDPLNRAKAIEQLFGKFQFARMSTLFKNVIEQGSQASEVLKLASTSSLELSMLAQKELSKIEQSPLYKFQKAIADFQAQLAPVGEQFMKALTPVINFGTDILKNFNNLGEGVKGFIVKFVAVAGVVGPVLLMSFGLIANAVANVIKGFALMKDIFNKTGKSSMSLGDQVNYMTNEQIQAAAIASSLDQVHSKLKQTFTSEAAAVDALTAAYQRSVAAQRGFAVPITPRGPVAKGPVRKYATGGFITGPGTGTSDSIPAMLSNGEAVIPAKSVSQNRDLVQSLINDSIPRFASGGIIGTPSETLMQQVKGTNAVIAYGAHQPFTSAHQGIAQRGMSMAEESGMPFFQFTSNQGKAKRSVLGDDLKSRMISEAIGRNPEFAKNPFDLMAILSKAGIKNVNILLGEDRMKSPVWEAAAKEFGITITKTGIPRPVGSTSGTMTRAAAASGNFGMFESLLASGMSKSTKDEIFKSLFAAGNAKVRKFSNGGMISGPGTGTSDSILARVSNGEAIIPAKSVARNPDMVRQLISGNIPGFSGGGIVQKMFRLLGNAGLFLTQGVNAAAGRDSGPGARRVDVINDLERGGAGSASPLLVSIAKKMGISLRGVENNPELQGDLRQAGTSIISTVINALKQSTKEFVKDADIEEIVVPALKGAAKNITLAGKNVAEALDQTLSERNVVTMRGIKGGSKQAAARVAGEVVESSGRAAVPGTRTYIGERATSQKVATILNPEIFAVKERASKSSKTGRKKFFAMQNAFGQDEPGQISHLQTGQEASFDEIEERFSPRQVESVRRKLGPTNVENAIAKERGTSSGEAFINAQNAVLDKPQNDPAMVSRDTRRRNSPHQQASTDGKDDGVAYSQARTNAIAQEEAKSATRRNRRVTSGGIITPGESQAQQVERTRGNRVASQGESFLPEGMVVINPNSPQQPIKPGMENAVTNPSEMMTARKMSSAEKAGASLKFGKGFQGKMFGASMGLGMASMFLPGELGQIAQAGSMATGVAGMFKDAGPKLGDLLIKFGKPLTRLIPYVGAAVVAFEIFDEAIVPLIRKNADAYKAITETLSITQEKLDKVNNFFGTDAKLAGIRATVSVTGDQTKEQGTIAEQFQQSQDFKDLYQESAQKMAKLSDQEFKRAMEAYSVDLFGMGYEAEAVKAIIDAIAIEAKKTSVSIAPELFSLDDPKARQLMNKNINSIISDTNQQIKDLESQVKSTTGIKFTSEDLKKTLSGEFDNLNLFVSPEIVQQLKSNSAQIGSYLNALGAQFQNGTLSAKEFTIQYDKLIAITKTMPENSGVEMLIASIRTLNPELAKALDLINAISGNSNSVGLVIEAANLGIARNIQGELALALEGDENAPIRDAVSAAYEDAINLTKENSNLVGAEQKKLKNIQKQSENLVNTEEKVNEKYDKRISQLDKIKTLNEQIAKSQQGQLTLAEALNKGDIAAAARAAIDVQNNDIQASLDNQKQGMDDARKAEIAPLKAAQDANTAAVDTLTDKIETLNKKTFEIKLPDILDGKELVRTDSEFGTDPMGVIGFLLRVAFNGISQSGKTTMAPGTSEIKIVDKDKVSTNANGGFIRGAGTGTSDDIPAMLSNGEYVIRANAVKTIGVDTLNKLNQADRLGFAAGGIVNAMRGKKPPRKDQNPNVDPIDPKSVAAYRERIAKLFKPTPRKEDPTWFDWTGGKQSMLAMLDDTGNYPGYYQWTAPYAVGGSFNKTKTGPSAYTWADSPFQKYNPLNSMETNKKLFNKLPEAFPNPAANQNPLDIIEAYKKMLEGRKRLAENVYLPDLNKDTTLMTSKNPILYTIATYAKAFSNRGIYTDSTGGQDLEKARALIELGRTSKMIPGWDGLDPKEFKNLVDAMHSEFGPQVTKGMIGKLGFGKRYDRLINPPKGPSAKLNYAENYLGISGSIPKDSPIYQYAYNYMTNDYEGGKRGRQNWFRGSPNSFMLNPKLGTYNRLGGYNGFAKGGMVGYANGGLVKGYKDGGIADIFSNPMGWINGLISGMYGSGGNPSSYLNASAGAGAKGAAKNILQGYKDWMFDPSDPVDYAFAALPGLKPAATVAKKASEAFKFPLVLQTPKKGLKITPTRLADEAEGITPGAYRTINGAEYYVKRPETTVETTGELIGSTLWARLGLGGPKLQMLNKTTLASKIIPDLIPSSPGYLRQYIEKAPNKVDAANTLAKATRKYIDEALPTNALLGNSDTHGMNILFNKKTKRFENIDLGITALTTESPDPVGYLFADELTRRTMHLVDGMKSSGFNLRQTNDILKKNGLSEVSGNDFRYASFPGVGVSDFAKNAKNKKNLTPQINKISKMLGFDLKKSGLDPVNVAAINAKTNPFIADMIKNNPELAKWMNLKSKTEDLESGMTGGLRELFYRLKNASNDPIQKFAKGGLVGYKDGGEVKPPKPRDPGGLDAQGNWHPSSFFDKPWNKGYWLTTHKDEQIRQQQWILSNDDSGLMQFGRTAAAFTPVVGSGLLTGNSISSFGKGDIAGGIFNAAGAALGGFGPKMFEKIGEFKPVQNFFNALMKPVQAVAKPIIKVATPAAQAVSNAAMRTAFRLGTVGIEQGAKTAATYVPSFVKSSMVLENNLPEINTNLKYIDYNKYIKPRHPNANSYATNLLRERYGSDYPLVHFNSHPGAVSKRFKQEPGFLETMKRLAVNKLLSTPKTIKKPFKDIGTLIAAKKFGIQTRNIPPLINPGKGTNPALQAAKDAVTKMRIGKDMVVDMKAANTEGELAEMYDMESYYDVPEELLVGIQGSFRNTKAPGLQSIAGNVSGTIFDTKKGLTAQDIYINLEDAYKGKGIGQRFTTQFMELLKNMGVKNIDIDAALSDGGYAWARANFKFSGRPKDLIKRMESIAPIINDPKFSKLLEQLKTADIEDLPMPKEILGLKTNWRRYFSEEKLIKQITTKYSPAAVSKDVTINTNTNSLGELIMRGSKWQGSKELGGNSILRQTIQDFAGSISAKAKGVGSKISSIFEKKTSPRFVQNNKTMREVFDEAMKNPGILTNRSANAVMSILRGNEVKSRYDMESFTRPWQEATDSMRRDMEDKYLFGEGNTSYGYLTNKNFLRRPLIKGRSLEQRRRTNFLNPFTDSSNQYGSVGLLLKDRILKNATATRDDSFRVYDEATGLKTDKFPFNNIFRESGYQTPYTNYVETQFEKYSRGDIAAIYVQSEKNLKEIKAVVKEMKLRIPVKLYNEKPVVQDFLDKIKNAKRNRLAAKIEQDAIDSFANGGMVGKYANGGMVIPIPEPAPKQFANGGMVRAAMGGMLIDGKFLGGFANGGMVPAKFAMGGYAMGTDTVPAMLTPGEFVIKKSAVDRIGPSALNKINGYAEGGLVGGMSTTSSDSVYNNNTYEINVNVSSNSNPDQIANAVMTKIRQIDNKRVRGSAF